MAGRRDSTHEQIKSFHLNSVSGLTFLEQIKAFKKESGQTEKFKII